MANYKAQSTEPVAEGQYPAFSCNVDSKRKAKADKLAKKVKDRKVAHAS